MTPSTKRRTAVICLLLFLLLAAVAIPYLRTSIRRAFITSESPYMMKGVMAGLYMYAEENDGVFPPENGIAGLRRLFTIENFKPKMLTISDTFPAAASVHDVGEGNTSYIYIGGHSLNSPPHTIILIEKPALGCRVVHVGLADGRVARLEDIAGP